MARPVSEILGFADNQLARQLFGECDAHLRQIEVALEVTIHPRGNAVAVSGAKGGVQRAKLLLEDLYGMLQQGREVDAQRVADGLRAVLGGEGGVGEFLDDKHALRTPRRAIYPRNAAQAAYVQMLRGHAVTLAIGPAGTGKTYLGVAVAVAAFLAGEVERIILTRPAVEAGERLGFLPGDLQAKVDPYLRPLYDALYDMLGFERVDRMLEVGELEIAPLAYMRGRTLNDAFIILDEAQNTTPEQMKMFLTRLGERSKAVVAGDVTQIDLPRGQGSGLVQALEILGAVAGIGITSFGAEDVVRHPLVREIVAAYARLDQRRN